MMFLKTTKSILPILLMALNATAKVNCNTPSADDKLYCIGKKACEMSTLQSQGILGQFQSSDSQIKSKKLKNELTTQLTEAINFCVNQKNQGLERGDLTLEEYEASVAEMGEYFNMQLAQIDKDIVQLSTADYNCDDKQYRTNSAELNDELRAITLKVKENFDFTNAFAAIKFPQVGQLVRTYDKGTENEKKRACNTTYVEYENGDRGFVTSAHCIFEDGKVRTGSLSNFEIRLGLFSDRPADNTYSIQSVACASTDPEKLKNISDPNSYKEECFIKINGNIDPSIKPIRRRYLTLDEVNKLRPNNTLFLVGFHPFRVRPKEDKPLPGGYPANTTRTAQECIIDPNKRDKVLNKPARYIFHSCGTMTMSSGAALLYFDPKHKEFVYVGTHIGAAPGNENNFAVNVLPSELVYEYDPRVVEN